MSSKRTRTQRIVWVSEFIDGVRRTHTEIRERCLEGVVCLISAADDLKSAYAYNLYSRNLVVAFVKEAPSQRRLGGHDNNVRM